MTAAAAAATQVAAVGRAFQIGSRACRGPRHGRWRRRSDTRSRHDRRGGPATRARCEVGLRGGVEGG
eukprot:864776-Prymnesium_polylepis.1